MVASGACGLVYEVAWARLLGVFLGASALAHAVVLSAFLAGLAIGNSLVGRWIDGRAHLALLVYAGLEAAIGVYGLLSPELRHLVGDLYALLVGDAAPGSASAAAKLACAGLYVLVPTIAMGGTIPTLSRFFVRATDEVGVVVARLYLVNTLGAAAGAFAAGMVLIPQLGVVAPIRVAGAANLAVGLATAIAWALTRGAVVGGGEPGTEAVAEEAGTGERQPSGAGSAGAAGVLVAVFAMGVATLTMEVVWTRLFAMVFGSSAQAFTLMLATFILGIALGSVAAPRLLARGRDPRSLLAGLLAAAALVLAVQLPLYERLPYWQFTIAHALERRAHVYPVYLAAQSVMAFAWMFPLTLLTGAALPIAARAFTTDPARVGASVGALFTANTLGNVLGPLVATFVFFPLLGLRHTVTVAIAMLAVAVAAARGGRALHRRRALQVVVASVLFALVAPAWDGGLLHAGGFRRWTLAPGASFAEFRQTRARSVPLWQFDGPTDSVIVLENRDGLRFLKVNGKTDASDAEDLATQRMVAHIPLLLHQAWNPGRARDVFVVGLGSGVTVGSAAMHEGVEVTCAELSEGVIAASRWFAHVNRGAPNLGNVTLHRADAREWLERSGRSWDVIVNQPSNPWIAGNAALFSREFFVAARERLAERGVFAQWMHVYAMDDATVELVMNTFASVFPHVTVWWPQGVDLVLIGTNEPLEPDLAALAAGLAQPWLQQEMASYDSAGLRIDRLERFLALQIQSARGFAAAFGGDGPRTSDLYPVLEYRAPLAQFVGARSELFVAMDERQRPGPDTALYYGGLAPSERDPRDLLAFFAARDTPFSQRLAGSLQHAVSGPLPPAAGFGDVATRAMGLPVLFEAWTDAMLDAANAPTRSDCQAYIDAATESLPVRATLYYRPPLDEARAVVDRCAAPLPPSLAGFFRAMEAELLHATGYAAEARALAERLLREPQAEAVVEALRALVDGPE